MIELYLYIKESLYKFKSSESGVTAVEYGLIAIAVAAMIVTVFYTFPNVVSTIRNELMLVATIVKGSVL